MQTLSPTAGPVQPSPLKALESWLWDHHYSARAVDAISAHAAEEGTPTGCPYLEPDDEAAATEAFVAAMDPMSQCSNAWDDPSIYIDAETLLAGGHMKVPVEALVPPELDPEPYHPTEEDELAYAAWQAAAEPPPISGGSPVAGPTAEDWAEYREEAERTDRMGSPRDAGDPPVYGYE